MRKSPFGTLSTELTENPLIHSIWAQKNFADGNRGPLSLRCPTPAAPQLLCPVSACPERTTTALVVFRCYILFFCSGWFRVHFFTLETLYEFPSVMTFLAFILPLISCFLSANVHVCGLAELGLVNFFWSKRVRWKFYWLHRCFWSAETEYWQFWMNFRVLVKSTWVMPYDCEMKSSGRCMC